MREFTPAERFAAGVMAQEDLYFFSRWMFLTGSKQQIARLARDGLKLVTEEKKPEERTAPEDLFIHSTLFVIVDKQGRLRASFENEDPHLKKKVIGAVRQLLREDERKK